MERKNQDKKIHLLNIAEELFIQKGVENTSVRDISTAGNVNVAMVSYYFGSKERMIEQLHFYRTRQTRQLFSELSEIIKEGKPEMQMKEVVRFVVSNIFKFRYFFGLPSFKQQEIVKEEWLKLNVLSVNVIDEIVKKGVASGVFTFAPKAEDLTSMIFGTPLYVLQNVEFYGEYIPNEDCNAFFQSSEKKLYSSLLLNVFAVLGFVAQ